MNLKISGALVAVSAALFSTSSNAALLFDPYIGLGFGIGSATIFVDDDNTTDNAQSFSATAGFDIPILRVELEYDYMTPKDTKLHLGLINAYAKLPTTTIQPYIGAGIGTVFDGDMNGTDIEKVTAYQGMLGITFNIHVLPLKIDVEGRVMYLPNIYDIANIAPDILQYEGRLKLRYIF